MPRHQTPRTKDFRALILLLGMGCMIPCYLFTVGNVLFSPWGLYAKNSFLLSVVVLLTCAIFCLLARTAARIEHFLAAHTRLITTLTVFLFAFCQIFAGLYMRMGVIIDQDTCYFGAMDYILTGTITDGNLVSMCTTPNNFALFYIILKVMQVTYALNLPISPYQSLIIFNTMLLCAGLICLLRSANMLGGAKAQALTAVNAILCLPMLYCTGEIYTDAFCAPVLMMIVYSMFRLARAKSGRSALFFSVLCGLLLLVGFEIRATIIIPIIALGIVMLLTQPPRRWACLFVIAAMIFSGHTAFMARRDFYYGKENLERYSMPVVHWLVMGTPDQYGYFYGMFNNDDFQYAFSIEDSQERKALLLERYIDKVYDLRYPDRFLSAFSRKNLANFGNGTFGFDYFIAHDAKNQEAVSSLPMDYRSAGYPAYYHITTGIFLAQMLFACTGCLQSLLKKQADFEQAFLFLSLVGIFLFMMLWEAGPRYFFHFMPVMLLASALAQSRIPCACPRRPS